ncbi:MAG TPA: protein kinase [Solirubrobacteraceae bacterium]|nr:protein kinase [Solirubrobacteraceae bacterium]
MSTEALFAGRYQLDRRLGVGGMSTVQLAFDTRLERHVAVKLLAEHLAADDGFVARFRREALAAARLVHPNVVQVYDFGTDEASGRQFIVMEYVEGQSCAELLRERGRLSPDEVVDICAQACRGLDYAHRNGVVHRDIKPGNLMVNPEGVVKIADFGIAKAADDSDITRVGSVIGTAAYLSPEQARGEPAGPPSDLYALGVVAYQLITGRLPYQGASLTELARQQETGPPTDLVQIVAEVSPALSAAVMRALTGDPAHRYQSAPEMEAALRAAEEGIAPPPLPTAAATVALGQTDATRAMPPQPRTLGHQPLQPVTGAPPRRRAAAGPVAAAPPAARRRGRGRTLFAFLLMAIIVAALVFAVIYLADMTGGVQTRDYSGDLQQVFDELRGAIRDNTR